MTSLSEQLALWVEGLRFEDLPQDLVETTRWRILDVVGLVLAGTATPFGRAVRETAVALGTGAPRGLLIGTGERVGIAGAAFANGALSQALEFDDTHNESIVHISSPSVAAGLALAEEAPLSGRDLILAVAIGNEISARVGCVAPGVFHRRGFHPTGLFAPFGVAYLAGKALGLDARALVNAAGIVGSFAAGLLQCWVDGTQSKFLHPGWAAQSGITAALLGRGGATGPLEVIEGRFGLIRSHLQDAGLPLAFERVVAGLGSDWESRRASFKPFPAAHVIHPYIDAILALRAEHGLAPEMVAEIRCPVAPYILPIVCEPVEEKRRPQSDSHGRVSFHYSLAEALATGRLGRDAYGAAARRDPRILALADRVVCVPDESFPGPERFKGAVSLRLTDGRTLERVEEHNRGSQENPMAPQDLLGKFADNAAERLDPVGIERLSAAILTLETAPAAAHLLPLTLRKGQ